MHAKRDSKQTPLHIVRRHGQAKKPGSEARPLLPRFGDCLRCGWRQGYRRRDPSRSSTWRDCTWPGGVAHGLRNKCLYDIARDVVERLDFLCPLTSKRAFGFEISGRFSRIGGTAPSICAGKKPANKGPYFSNRKFQTRRRFSK